MAAAALQKSRWQLEAFAIDITSMQRRADEEFA
jgi:hypothetical protein